MKIVDHQNTKIVATVGPASNSYSMLLNLVKAGVDVFRLNFSHGNHEDHLEVVNHINYINEKYGLHVSNTADAHDHTTEPNPSVRSRDTQQRP